jgi:hypothetical protein
MDFDPQLTDQLITLRNMTLATFEAARIMNHLAIQRITLQGDQIADSIGMKLSVSLHTMLDRSLLILATALPLNLRTIIANAAHNHANHHVKSTRLNHLTLTVTDIRSRSPLLSFEILLKATNTLSHRDTSRMFHTIVELPSNTLKLENRRGITLNDRCRENS